jgi:hypothetical protein
MVLLMTDRPTATTKPTRLWKCVHCGHVLGQIANGVLHEGEVNKSALPVVRKCPGCGRRNVKLSA